MYPSAETITPEPSALIALPELVAEEPVEEVVRWALELGR
jgi:hypothetical protein